MGAWLVKGVGRGSHSASRRFGEVRVLISWAFEFCDSNEQCIVDVCKETILTSPILICFAFGDDLVAWGLESRVCSIQSCPGGRLVDPIDPIVNSDSGFAGLSFVGARVRIKQAQHEIFINQRKYLKEILKRFSMEECRSVGTPVTLKEKLQEEDRAEPVDAAVYSSLVGCLV
ncbi:hypothetical protein CRG98_008920 [Punica granatum]|uniref:Reverse transcriptase Ty1/copia-type domain-containing protein n=1 Tax=Punica granatum TaxID=22663 RepID=A0A2I0KQC5_PUNGR|nr:hypothetical protein CRG98_008920 [Punica granatum]